MRNNVTRSVAALRGTTTPQAALARAMGSIWRPARVEYEEVVPIGPQLTSIKIASGFTPIGRAFGNGQVVYVAVTDDGTYVFALRYLLPGENYVPDWRPEAAFTDRAGYARARRAMIFGRAFNPNRHYPAPHPATTIATRVSSRRTRYTTVRAA